MANDGAAIRASLGAYLAGRRDGAGAIFAAWPTQSGRPGAWPMNPITGRFSGPYWRGAAILADGRHLRFWRMAPGRGFSGGRWHAESPRGGHLGCRAMARISRQNPPAPIDADDLRARADSLAARIRASLECPHLPAHAPYDCPDSMMARGEMPAPRRPGILSHLADPGIIGIAAILILILAAMMG